MMRHSLNRDSNYLYRIQPHPFYGFATGFDAKGRQAIVGIYENDEILIFFTQEGNVDELVQRRHQTSPASDVSDDLESEVDALADASLVKRCVISVKKFHVPLSGTDRELRAWEYEGIGIEDVPWHFHAKQSGLKEFEIGEHDEEIKEWLGRGDFVLWWGNDYDLNAEGEVVSS